MHLRVRFFGLLRLDLNIQEEELILQVDKATVGQVVDALVLKHGPKVGERLLAGENIRQGTIILVNGKNIHHLKGLSSEVRDGDVLSVFPPGAGG